MAAHALLSASGAELWLNCPGSAIANRQYPSEDTAYTLEGTIAHEVAQVYADAMIHQAGCSELDAEIQRLRDQYGEQITGEMLECAEGYAEYIRQHMADGDTVLLEQRLDFSPWVPGGFGTGDCVIIREGGVTVIDYKYGQGVAVETVGNPQMMLYALGAINDYGCVYDVDNVCISIYQPRINNISEATMDAAELIDWGDRVVKPTAAEALSKDARFTAGAHCRKFCKHAGRCPTLTKYACDFVEVHGLRYAVPHMTADQYVEVVRMEPLIKMWLEHVCYEAREQILDGKPIDGLKVVEGRSLRKWDDEDAVYDTLREGGYTDDDLTEVSVRTVAAMEKAIGKKRVAELVGSHIVKAPGKPTLVLDTDKRPNYDPGADFKALD